MTEESGPAPFTEEQLENLRISILPSLPSFRKEDWSISSADIPEMCKRWNWPRTPEQLSAYKAYWDGNFEGRAPFAVLLGILKTCHMAGPWLRGYVKACDKNGDGFIQKDEFELLFKIFELHFPGIKKTFEDFVAEADSNRDGKVSIDEAVAWHERQRAV